MVSDSGSFSDDLTELVRGRTTACGVSTATARADTLLRDGLEYDLAVTVP